MVVANLTGNLQLALSGVRTKELRVSLKPKVSFCTREGAFRLDLALTKKEGPESSKAYPKFPKIFSALRLINLMIRFIRT